MTTRRWPARVAVIFLPALVVIATARCYAPTEVTVVLSTDLACTEKPRTAIFKGVPFGATAEAETTECTPPQRAGDDSAIGSLVFVPSGSTNGRAAVKAVLARRGKSPAECESNSTDCIFASRSFSYVAHSSRRIPIRMLEECIGQRCPDGFTCVGKDKCGLNEDTCEGETAAARPECRNVVPPLEGGPPPFLDGGGPTDAAPDAPPTPTFCSPKSKSVLYSTTGVMPVYAAASATSLFWAEPLMGSDQVSVWKISKSGGDPQPLGAAGGFAGDAITALGLDGDVAIFGHGAGFNAYGVDIGGTEYPFGAARPTAVVGGGGTVLVGTDAAIYQLDSATKTFTLISQIATSSLTSAPNPNPNNPTVGGVAFFAGAPDGVHVLESTAIGSTFKMVPASPFGAILTTSTTGKVFAAGGTVAQFDRISQIELTKTTPVATVFNRPSSIAADDTHVYGADGPMIKRWTIASGGGGFDPVKTVNTGTLDHVSVDASCIYYWFDNGSGTVTLHTLAKDKTFSADASQL